jgi:hypothetical protein
MKKKIVPIIVSLWLLGGTIILPAVASADGGYCTPVEVGTLYYERVHIRCTSTIMGFTWFAVPTSSSDMANQVLSLATTALTSNLALYITFDKNDNSGPAYGCALDSCRPILALELCK